MKQSLFPLNNSHSMSFGTAGFLPLRKVGGFSNGSVKFHFCFLSMLNNQGIWIDGLVLPLTPDRLLSRQRRYGCNVWLTYYLDFRNEIHLFHFCNLLQKISTAKLAVQCPGGEKKSTYRLQYILSGGRCLM